MEGPGEISRPPTAETVEVHKPDGSKQVIHRDKVKRYFLRGGNLTQTETDHRTSETEAAVAERKEDARKLRPVKRIVRRPKYRDDYEGT